MEQEQAILEYISRRCAEAAGSGERRGVSAAEVASQFGMWQDEASRLLSGMTKAGTLEAAGADPYSMPRPSGRGRPGQSRRKRPLPPRFRA